jgi:hypothetical protein
MYPSLKDQLQQWKRKNNVSATKKKRSQQKPQKPKFDDLSESDIKRLRGIDMPTYRRHKGALRQR